MQQSTTPPQDVEDPVYPGPIERVNAFIQRFGDAVSVALDPLDEDGFTEIRYGELIVGINAHADRDVLLFLVCMGDLPDRPDARLFQHLLELNFLATGPCAFAIDERSQRLFLRAMRPIEGLQYEEFASLLQTVGQLAASMRKRLTA